MWKVLDKLSYKTELAFDGRTSDKEENGWHLVENRIHKQRTERLLNVINLWGIPVY